MYFSILLLHIFLRKHTKIKLTYENASHATILLVMEVTQLKASGLHNTTIKMVVLNDMLLIEAKVVDFAKLQMYIK